jgi:hypothetical protein
MKLFQASMHADVLTRYHDTFGEKINVLISLAYNESERKEIAIDNRHRIDGFVADSGAFSVAQGTSDLTIEQVISHFKRWGHLYDLYYNFDVDFSEQGFPNNIYNQYLMEKAGLAPVPVIHNFYDGEIDYYVKSGKYSWLALGSTQASSFESIKYAVERIKKGNPYIRIHWFGGSRFDWLIYLPIASCDTTSWAAIGAYGEINYWNPEVPGVDKTHCIDFGGIIKEKYEKNYYENYPWKKDLDEYLDGTFGLTHEDIRGYRGKFHMQVINARFYAELERRINDERTKLGVSLE